MKEKINAGKSKLVLIEVLFLLLILNNFVTAHENFTETKQLIDSNTSCDKLTNEQLNEMGDYYMEQMHPGEAHELMHNMMGGENSETTKQMHIQMAKSIYCGESSEMMGMMNIMMGGNMMQEGMMSSRMMTGNMMNNSGYSYTGNIFSLLYLILLLGLIIIIILIIIKLVKDINKKENKKK